MRWPANPVVHEIGAHVWLADVAMSDLTMVAPAVTKDTEPKAA